MYLQALGRLLDHVCIIDIHGFVFFVDINICRADSALDL